MAEPLTDEEEEETGVTRRKPLTTSFRKCHILKPEELSPNLDSTPRNSIGGRLGKQTFSPLHYASPPAIYKGKPSNVTDRDTVVLCLLKDTKNLKKVPGRRPVNPRAFEAVSSPYSAFPAISLGFTSVGEMFAYVAVFWEGGGGLGVGGGVRLLFFCLFCFVVCLFAFVLFVCFFGFFFGLFVCLFVGWFGFFFNPTIEVVTFRLLGHCMRVWFCFRNSPV